LSAQGNACEIFASNWGDDHRVAVPGSN
jgi:hypothetical protein